MYGNLNCKTLLLTIGKALLLKQSENSEPFVACSVQDQKILTKKFLISFQRLFGSISLIKICLNKYLVIFKIIDVIFLDFSKEPVWPKAAKTDPIDGFVK